MGQAMEAGQSSQDMKDQMRRFGSLANIQGLSSLLGGAGDLAGSFDGSGEGFDFKSLFENMKTRKAKRKTGETGDYLNLFRDDVA